MGHNWALLRSSVQGGGVALLSSPLQSWPLLLSSHNGLWLAVCLGHYEWLSCFRRPWLRPAGCGSISRCLRETRPPSLPGPTQPSQCSVSQPVNPTHLPPLASASCLPVPLSWRSKWIPLPAGDQSCLGDKNNTNTPQWKVMCDDCLSFDLSNIVVQFGVTDQSNINLHLQICIEFNSEKLPLYMTVDSYRYIIGVNASSTII